MCARSGTRFALASREGHHSGPGPERRAASPPTGTCEALRPASPMATNAVVSSKQAEEVVRGVQTEVVCTAFANMILVVVTQYGKMGTLVSVEPSVVADGISSPLLTTKVLLGKDEPLVHICAKHLVTSVSQEAGNKSVLLAMALKDKSIEGIRTLQALIHRCRVW